jgi:hypothetical protein
MANALPEYLTPEYFVDALLSFSRLALDRGMTPPFTIYSFDQNGSAATYRFDDPATPMTCLRSEQIVSDNIASPIKLTLIDSKDATMRGHIDPALAHGIVNDL